MLSFYDENPISINLFVTLGRDREMVRLIDVFLNRVIFEDAYDVTTTRFCPGANT